MMFPQGKIESLYHREFEFARGVEKILAKCDPPPVVMFNINLVDYFSKVSPTLFIRTQKYQGDLQAKAMEEAFKRFHTHCISLQHEALV